MQEKYKQKANYVLQMQVHFQQALTQN